MPDDRRRLHCRHDVAGRTVTIQSPSQNVTSVCAAIDHDVKVRHLLTVVDANTLVGLTGVERFVASGDPGIAPPGFLVRGNPILASVDALRGEQFSSIAVGLGHFALQQLSINGSTLGDIHLESEVNYTLEVPTATRVQSLRVSDSRLCSLIAPALVPLGELLVPAEELCMSPEELAVVRSLVE
jgi:hypothetical protein